MSLRKILTLSAVAIVGAATVATADVKLTRDKMMWLNGASMGVLAPMAKGEADYDPKAAALAFQAMNATSLVFADLYPAGSESTEGKFYGSPKIWEDRAGFEAAVASFSAATQAAMDAKPADKEAFLAVFGPIGKACGDCHEKYRVKVE